MTFRQFFKLVFSLLRARILLLFEAFAGGFFEPCVVKGLFFMDSKGDVPRVFSGLCFVCFGQESCCCSRLSQAVFQGHVP